MAIEFPNAVRRAINGKTLRPVVISTDVYLAGLGHLLPVPSQERALELLGELPCGVSLSIEA